MRRTPARWIALTLLVGTALSACGDDGGSDDDRGSDDPVVVEITFEDGEVTPNGERIDVAPGQPVELQVTADEPGEIHIHSDPEHELAYDEGTQTLDQFEIDRPGIVVVESHNLEQVIVQLEVK